MASDYLSNNSFSVSDNRLIGSQTIDCSEYMQEFITDYELFINGVHVC